MFVLLIIPFRPSLSDSEYEKCIRYELGVIMPVLGLVIPFLLITIISRRYVVERTQVQEDYISAELDYLNQYKRDQNEIRDFRHEIMSNLASLSAMYTDKNYDDAGEHLKPYGRLYLEIGYDQGADVSALLKEAGYRDIEVMKDYGGNDRVVKAQYIP